MGNSIFMARLLKNHIRYLIFCLCCFFVRISVGQESGVNEFLLPANTPRLFVVKQLGEDVLVDVGIDGIPGFTVNHPVGRTGPELFLVGPFPEDQIIVVSVRSPGRRNAFSFSYQDLDPDSPMITPLGTFTDAGILASRYEMEELGTLIELYEEVADAAISEYGLSALAGYIQAALLFDVSAYDEASAVLARSRNNPALAPFDYKVDMLEAGIHFAQDNHAEARGLFESLRERINALDVPRSHVDLDVAQLELTLGFTQLLTGAMDEGKANLDHALTIGNQYMDAGILGMVHNNLGGYYSIIPDFESSVRHFNLAIDYLREVGETQELIYTLENLGLIYGWMGEFRLARETTHLALSLAEERGVLSELSGAYTSIVSLYNKLGEYQVAEELSRMAMDLDLDSDREWRSVTMKNIHADALLGQNKTGEAIEKYLQALAFFKQDGMSVRVMTTYERLISAYLQANELENAEVNLQVARALAASFTGSGVQSVLERFNAMEAELLLAQGRPEEAIEILNGVLKEDYESVQPEQVKMAALMMQAKREAGDVDGAIFYGDVALDFIDKIREQLDFARLGPAWSEKAFPVFLRATDNLMQKYEQSNEIEFAIKAFHVAEMGLAFNLAQQRLVSQEFDSSESDTSRALRNELSRLARARASAQGQKNTDLEIDYFRTLERYQASMGTVRQDNGLEVLDVHSIQQRLESDTLLLEYVCVPGSDCYAFSVSRDHFGAANIGSFDEIEILTSAVQTEVRSEYRRNTPASRRLGNILFGNILEEEVRDIRIVSNYPLNLVPLAAMGLPAEQDRFESAVSRFRLTSLPSITSALLTEFESDRRFEFELSILADPEFNSDQNVQLASLAADPSDSMRGWYDGLNRLPWSAREAKSLEAIYSNESIQVMTGELASKANLLGESTRNSRVIHIASHGYFNTATPDLVGIATSPVDGDTGFVSLEELMLYPFNAELVVISGCETGLGDLRGGEGMISLARGFLGQGVNHVISTLWPVSDRASAEFMKLFYEALHNQGLSVSESLQSAQVRLSQIPQYSAPFYWAPYVLTSLGH